MPLTSLRALTGQEEPMMVVAQLKTQEGGPAVMHVNAKLYGFLKDNIQMLKIIPGDPVAKEQSIFTTFPKSVGTVSLLQSSQMSDSGDMYEDEDIPPTPPPPKSRQKLNCVLFERARQIESIEEYDSESGDSEYECESENSAYEYESEDSEYASESEMYRHTQRRVITVPEQTSEEDYSEYDRPTQQQVITALPEQERDEESEGERKKTVPVKKKIVNKTIRKPTQRKDSTSSSELESEEEIGAKRRKLVPEKEKIETKNIRKPTQRRVITSLSEQESEEEIKFKRRKDSTSSLKLESEEIKFKRKLVPRTKKKDTKILKKTTQRQSTLGPALPNLVILQVAVEERIPKRTQNGFTGSS
ncbi:troponin T, fast skeletal muscle-like [Mytilus edulis]|uniref:troponin T, fast skeletal muscle-like n=1 Tax=Mytilus edulis TaxID=6550 RepID=UPI0039F0DA6B